MVIYSIHLTTISGQRFLANSCFLIFHFCPIHILLKSQLHFLPAQSCTHTVCSIRFSYFKVSQNVSSYLIITPQLKSIFTHNTSDLFPVISNFPTISLSTYSLNPTKFAQNTTFIFHTFLYLLYFQHLISACSSFTLYSSQCLPHYCLQVRYGLIHEIHILHRKPNVPNRILSIYC